MTARPRTAGVIGWPISHSLSPLIHRCWADRESADVVYLPLLVEPGAEALSRALSGLAAAGFAGVNVTLPHKEDALRLADAASESARSVGAANMLTFERARIFADNSDAEGFATAIRPLLANLKEARALVLGGGGAARAVAFALRGLSGQGVSKVSFAVANRTGAKAASVARDFGGETLAWDLRSDALGGFDILINATSLGMKGMPPLEIDLRRLPANAIVADIVYSPLETALLKAARARSLATLDGLGMLMHQAARAYVAWLGRSAPVDAALRAALEKALAERGA